ncbi:MAG: adenosylhomocysteinase [Spirochaetota bacterium]
MPRLGAALIRLPSLEGRRIAFSMHLDPKMIPFVEGVMSRGAEVFLTTCNPDTVREAVVAHLKRRGAQVRAEAGMSQAEYAASAQAALEWGPDHLCEMGGDLSAAFQRGPYRPDVRAGLEATGSGVSRIEAIEPPYPVFNWDDLPVKEGLHNRYMVGLSAWHTFFRRTGLTLHEKRVLVVGYGDVGAGVAQSARAYGAHVMVAERDGARRLLAGYAGWELVDLDGDIGRADVVVTATGAPDVISAPRLERMKDGAFVFNVGHRSEEIDVAYLRRHPTTEIIPFVEEIALAGKRVYLLAAGSMFNLVAGPGDSLNAFDVTLAVFAEAIGFLVTEGVHYPAGLHVLPEFVWRAAVS